MAKRNSIVGSFNVITSTTSKSKFLFDHIIIKEVTILKLYVIISHFFFEIQQTDELYIK